MEELSFEASLDRSSINIDAQHYPANAWRRSSATLELGRFDFSFKDGADEATSPAGQKESGGLASRAD
ncbi:MAG: hypothetical protein R3E58_04045 [Phycisphaerae bacterium]